MKKLFSLILALAMLVSIVPSYAEDGTDIPAEPAASAEVLPAEPEKATEPEAPKAEAPAEVKAPAEAPAEPAAPKPL